MSMPVGSTEDDHRPTAGSLCDSTGSSAGPQIVGSSRRSSSETPSPGEESVGSAATDGEDGDDTSGYWLLCAVICSGKGLYVGDGQLGDLFCMLHTSDGVCRSRTAVTGMVYSNANPAWPSNGNGNAFVLPVRRSKRQTDLVITVWDGSESLEEAIPVGKVHVNLQQFMNFPSLPPGKDTKDDAPPRFDFDVDLVPRLAATIQEQAQLTVMLERASPAYEGDSAKDRALHDLLRRLGLARKREQLKKLMQWDREYAGNSLSRANCGAPQMRDYSLVSLLTSDPPSSTCGEVTVTGGGCGADGEEGAWGFLSLMEGRGGDRGYDERVDERWGDGDMCAVEDMMEHLSKSWSLEGEGGCPIASVPVRAQAALAARIKHVALQDGCLVMEKGTTPTSFFYIVSGMCLVTVGGQEVNRINAGEFLGEIGVIYESTRIADVRAVGDTEVLVLSGDDLSLALDMFPGLYKELQKVAQMRFDHVKSLREGSGKVVPHVELRKRVSEFIADSDKGALSQFLAFMRNIVNENKSLNDLTTPHPSRMSRFNSSGIYTAGQGRFAAGVHIGSLDDMSKLHSICEAEVHSGVPARPLVGAPPHLSDHLHEQALSARLAMEESGSLSSFANAIGDALGDNGITIPNNANTLKGGRDYARHGSEHGGSLRTAMFDNVGSLEHARQVGGSDGLSPIGHHWDRTSSDTDDSGSEASGEDFSDSPLPGEDCRSSDGNSGGSSRSSRRNSGADSAAAATSRASRKRDKCLSSRSNSPAARLEGDKERLQANKDPEPISPGAAPTPGIGVAPPGILKIAMLKDTTASGNGHTHLSGAEEEEEELRSRSHPRHTLELDKKKHLARSDQGKQPRPRRSMFRIRFRKAHDTYTAEELGATPRRLRRLNLSGVYLQNLKEHDIQSYFIIEAAAAAAEQHVRDPLLQSDVVRGDKAQQEVTWGRLATMDLEEELLFSEQRLCFCFYQKRQLWSTRVIGYAFVSLRDAFARPGVSMQSTYELFKDKDEAERRSRSAASASASASSSRPTSVSGSRSTQALGALQDGGSGGGTGTVASATGTASAGGSTSSTMVRSWSSSSIFRRGGKEGGDDDDAPGKVRGHVTMTWVVEDCVKLPFFLSVPPLRPGQTLYKIVDHVGVVVALLEYLGRSRCAWCTNVDPAATLYSEFLDADVGPKDDPCCNACAMKGWIECVILWDKKQEVRLGSVFTDVTPRKHARARICDQNDTHFASVRAACTSKPEISTGVRFKIVPTFSELSVKACGSIISGKTCSSSFQVSERRGEEAERVAGAAAAAMSTGRRRSGTWRVGHVIADINRGGSTRDPANVLVQSGKDAVRSVLIAIGIDEACRLRPRAVYDGVAFKDKFDKEYQREDEENGSQSAREAGGTK